MEFDDLRKHICVKAAGLLVPRLGMRSACFHADPLSLTLSHRSTTPGRMQLQSSYVSRSFRVRFKPCQLPDHFRNPVCLLKVSCLFATSHKASDITLGLPLRASLRPQTFSVPRRLIPAPCLQPYCILQPRPGLRCSGGYSSKAAVLSFKRLGPHAVHFPSTNSLAQVSHSSCSTPRRCSASESSSKIWR